MDFQDNMRLGRDNAKRDRDRGGSAVRVFRTATARARWRGEHSRSRWDRACEAAAAHFRSEADQALADLEAALYGHEWEGL